MTTHHVEATLTRDLVVRAALTVIMRNAARVAFWLLIGLGLLGIGFVLGVTVVHPLLPPVGR